MKIISIYNDDDQCLFCVLFSKQFDAKNVIADAKNFHKNNVKSTTASNKKNVNKFKGMQNISLRVERATTAKAHDQHDSPNHQRPLHLFAKANTK